MINDPRYAPVEHALPPLCPAITRAEAEIASQRLLKAFGKRTADRPAQYRDATWNRPARRCWLSSKPTHGDSPHKGWPRLIHDISHIVFAARCPRSRLHGDGHAALEAEIASYVVQMGWLTGSLKPKAAAKPTGNDKLASLVEREQRWEAKLRRAENALKKIRRQRKAFERRALTAEKTSATVAELN